MKKQPFYTELSYVFGLIIMAFGATFTAKADFGMSMVVAPAYILHLQVSQWLPWFSFGVAEYCLQGLLVAVTAVLMRKFKRAYLFSFVTAVLYGTFLDGAVALLSALPAEALWLRLVWYAVGTLCCSFAVSLFFHTYLSPEAYELIVKEIAAKFHLNVNKVKTVYDIGSTIAAIALSFAFFGFGVFRGMGIGTVVCAVLNGPLIALFSKGLERVFVFKNRFAWEPYFT
ncbi:MAG: hypothetical protein IJW89_02160 [Clostridia bacterium]|nr:hypothetical protein [Clostridia bacterium]